MLAPKFGTLKFSPRVRNAARQRGLLRADTETLDSTRPMTNTSRFSSPAADRAEDVSDLHWPDDGAVRMTFKEDTKPAPTGLSLYPHRGNPHTPFDATPGC